MYKISHTVFGPLHFSASHLAHLPTSSVLPLSDINHFYETIAQTVTEILPNVIPVTNEASHNFWSLHDHIS